MPFFEFIQKYFSVNLADYPAIGIDLEINKFIFIFLIGSLVGTIAVNYRRASMHLVVRSLMRYEAKTEESARSLHEMKIDTLGAKIALRSGGRLSKVVKRVGAKEYTYEEYSALIKDKSFKEESFDFENSKFYICDEGSDDARYIFERCSSSVLNTVLFCILLTAIAVCLMLCMPGILSLVNSLLSK